MLRPVTDVTGLVGDRVDSSAQPCGAATRPTALGADADAASR